MSTAVSGDQSLSYFLRQKNTEIKQNIERFTSELTTGQIADVRDALAGNYSFLTDVERKSEVLGRYAISSAEATIFTDAVQLALTHFRETTSTLSSSLLTAGTSPTAAKVTSLSGEARASFDTMVDTLNSETAGRYIFSGNKTDQRPLIDASIIIDGLRAALSGATTPDDIVLQATAWFDDPGGFAALAYEGGDDPLSPFLLSPSESASVDIRANDPELIVSLRNAAIAALANDPAFSLDLSEQASLFYKVGENSLINQNGVIGIQSKVGYIEAKIDNVTARNSAEVTSLNMAKNALLEADPYEAATKLEEAQFQLQSLYSVTVRMSQLSLVNFL